MRIVANARLIKRNRQITTNLFLITFVVLIGGFFFVNINLFTGQRQTDPLLLLAQTTILPLAFVLTLFSIRMTNLWGRRPYPEQVIAEGMKGLSNKSVLYHYHHIPARHVLICPQGVFSLTTRWHIGSYTVKDDRWKTNAGVIARFFSSLRMDGIGDPTLDAGRQAQQVQKLIDKVAPGVPVKPLIVFINPAAQVQIDGSSVPVLFADAKREPNLTVYLRELNKQSGEGKKAAMPLTEAQIAAFEKVSGIDLQQSSVTGSA